MKKTIHNKTYLSLISFNTSIQIVGKGINVLLGFLTISLLTRYLGLSGYGNFTLVFTYTAFFSVFADFGLQLLVIKELSQKKVTEEIIYGTYFWIKIALGIISLFLPIIIVCIFPYSVVQKWGIIIASLAVCISNFLVFGSTIFQYKTKLDYITYIDIFIRVVTVLCICISIGLNLNFYFIVGCILIGNVLGLLFQWIILRKIYRFVYAFDYIYAKKLLIKTIPIGITLLFSITYFKIDTILLSIYKGSVEVGVYSLSYKILENLLVLWSFYMASTYPLLTKFYHEKDMKQYRNLINTSLRVIIISSISIIIISFVTAPLVISILGGKSFFSSILLLRILIISIPFFFVNNFFYYYNLTKSHNTILVLGLVFSLVINLAMNLLAIPFFGYFGASVTTVITEILLTLFYVIAWYNMRHKK